ncbi:MAG: apolipoprotein N-acyltransferase [Spirochaeta sp.]|jgi:apolipoprotein N-acyltransferase|nr:apolipoprotein N-acyltransferase [Spirochaeta sp.]
MFVLVLFSSVLLSLALPNELFPRGLTLPGLVALVPVFLVVFRARSRRQASRYGALFGAISTAIANYWLAFFGEFSIWTIGGAVVGYTGYNYILFGFLYHISHRDGGIRQKQNALRPLYVAIVWTGYEYLKSVGFLGYPWGLIGYPLAINLHIAQIAEITGVWGVSFLAAYVNAAVAERIAVRDLYTAIRQHRKPEPRQVTALNALQSSVFSVVGRHGVAALLLLAVAGGFGAVRLPTITPTDTVEMLLVQQNVDSWVTGGFPDALDRAQRITVSAILDDREAQRPPVDAVVWSETSLRVPYDRNVEFYRSQPAALPFISFLRALNIPLVTGTPQRAANGRDYHNSAVVIRPDGTITGAYGKQQLVPFAESIPFWNVSAVQDLFRNVIGLSGTWVPGSGSVPLELPLRDGGTLAVGTPICFEDGFGWVPREMVNNGADLLVNLTNNSWSRQDSAQTQHYAAAQLRTIELRTTLVRGTNSGLSGVVDARGVLIAEMPMFESTARRVTVPLYPDTWTLYRAWGDWLGVAMVAGALLLVIVPAVSTRWNRRQGRRRL